MKIIAITDERNFCECCGKKNLKKVVVLQNEAGTHLFYGVNCAAKAMGINQKYKNNDLAVAERIQDALKKHTPRQVFAMFYREFPKVRLMDGYIMIVGTKIRVEFDRNRLMD